MAVLLIYFCALETLRVCATDFSRSGYLVIFYFENRENYFTNLIFFIVNGYGVCAVLCNTLIAIFIARCHRNGKIPFAIGKFCLCAVFVVFFLLLISNLFSTVYIPILYVVQGF